MPTLNHRVINILQFVNDSALQFLKITRILHTTWFSYTKLHSTDLIIILLHQRWTRVYRFWRFINARRFSLHPHQTRFSENEITPLSNVQQSFVILSPNYFTVREKKEKREKEIKTEHLERNSQFKNSVIVALIILPMTRLTTDHRLRRGSKNSGEPREVLPHRPPRK